MLSKLALIGAVAYQTQATSQFFSEEDDTLLDMVNLYQDVQLEHEELQNLFKITLTRGGRDQFRKLEDNFEDAMRNYKVDRKLEYKAKTHLRALLETKEAEDIKNFIDTNMPYRWKTEEEMHQDEINNRVDSDGKVWNSDFKPLLDQRQKVLDAHRALENHTQNKFHETSKPEQVMEEWNVDEKYWEQFDYEVGQMVKARQTFLKTKWARTLMEKVNALRETKAYDMLESDAKTQIASKNHQNVMEAFDNLMFGLFNLHKVTGAPSSFQRGNFMKQIALMQEFFNKTAVGGDVDAVFEWISHQQE